MTDQRIEDGGADMSPEAIAHAARLVACMQARYGDTWLEAETYTYTLDAGGYISWDITRVKAWVTAHPEADALEVPRAQLALIALNWETHQAIVAAADPSRPGIAAPIIDRTQTPPVVCYILVDGVHRATRAYLTGQPFFACVLPDDVSRECVIDAPPGTIP